MSADEEREMWTELLSSKGWTAIGRWAQSEWAAQKDQAIAHAAGETADAIALGKLRQILAADKAIQRLLDHPRERLELLTRQAEGLTQPRSYARGGV